MHLSRKLAVCVACAILIYSQITLADGAGAVAAYYRNLANVGLALNYSQQNIQATPTLVRGIYKLTVKPSGQFMSYVNEGGTITGDYKAWEVIASPPRPMNSSELAELRGEIIRSIDFDKLIKVKYGDGGGRKMVMFSAVDCPFCAKFEARAAKLASSMNTTFYVVPSALRPLSYGSVALPSWRTATSIWCAKDNASAWLAYWSKKNLPASQSCEFDERTAEVMGNQLEELLSSVGIKRSGVPAILREDGTVFTPQPDFDKSYATSTFGPEALASIRSVYDEKPLKWLAESKSSDSKQINLGGALQKLFK
ncbi:MAG: thioredoxin fold domain-containing protein [Gallionellaceae bacterium]|nr:thioredoxin fold domain-containing protein [Gallionellaceae bacterium]